MATHDGTGAPARALSLDPTATEAGGSRQQYPAPDAVVIPMTRAIEADLRARGVFADVLDTPPHRRIAAVAEWLVPPAMAAALLADAQQQNHVRRHGLKNAYGSFASSIKYRMKLAEKRAAMLAKSEATPWNGLSGTRELWNGTRAQLCKSLGLPSGAPFPGGPGAGKRKSVLTDARGLKVEIEFDTGLMGTTWGIYLAVVTLSDEFVEQRRAALQQRERDELRLQEIKTRPATPQAFREFLATMFSTGVDLVLVEATKRTGFRLSDAAKEEFLDACRDAYAVLKHEAEIIGDPPAKALQRVAIEQAKRNAPLQAFLRSVTGSNGYEAA